MVLKEMIFFYSLGILWEDVVVLKEVILAVSTLGGCGGLERTHF